MNDRCQVFLTVAQKVIGLGLSVGLLTSAAQGLDRVGRFPRADLSNLIVAGDSLTAGYQNSQLIESGQVHGYANVVASQAGVDLNLPLIPAPGFPQVSTSLGPFAVVTGYIPQQRTNIRETRDVAVPGYTLEAFLFLAPRCNPDPAIPGLVPYPIEYMAFAILDPDCRFPAPQVIVASRLRPSTAILWIGNNDALFPLLFGGRPTNQLTFAVFYEMAISAMDRASGTLVVANIPDVTLLPYLTSVTDLATTLHQPVEVIQGLLNLQPGDKVTPYAFALISQMGPNLSPLPDSIPDPLSGSLVPVVLRADDLRSIQRTVRGYNAIIAAAAERRGATLVDIKTLVDQISERGVRARGQRLTMSFMSGLFSLDGVHPTNTGYAVIANEFIKTMNRSLRTAIPPVSIEQVAKEDPLIFGGQGVRRTSVSTEMADSLRSLLAH